MRRNKIIVLAFCIGAVFIGIFSLFWGAYDLGPLKIIRILFSRIIPGIKDWDSIDESALLNVRLPRIIFTALAGATLSVSGAVLQAMFRNPLVSPYLLGISNGATFGAALTLVLFSAANSVLFQFSAFIFGFLAVLLTISIARLFSDFNNLVIILVGVVVGALFRGGLSLIEYFAKPDDLQLLVIWKMGSFARTEWNDVLIFLPIAVIGCSLIVSLSFRINILSMGEEEASVLGIRPFPLKLTLIILTSVMTSVAVCLCGPIGWIGLVIPHTVRLIIGPDNRLLLPGCIGLGASFLLLVDIFARKVYKAEIPVEIITTLIGGVFFIFLLIRMRRKT